MVIYKSTCPQLPSSAVQLQFLLICNTHIQMAFSSLLQTSPQQFPEENDCQAFTTLLALSVGGPALAPSCLGRQLARGARSLTPQHLCSSGPALALHALLEASCLCGLQDVLQKVGVGQGSLWDPVQQTVSYLKGHSTLE